MFKIKWNKQKDMINIKTAIDKSLKLQNEKKNQWNAKLALWKKSNRKKHQERLVEGRRETLRKTVGGQEEANTVTSGREQTSPGTLKTSKGHQLGGAGDMGGQIRLAALAKDLSSCPGTPMVGSSEPFVLQSQRTSDFLGLPHTRRLTHTFSEWIIYLTFYFFKTTRKVGDLLCYIKNIYLKSVIYSQCWKPESLPRRMRSKVRSRLPTHSV